ncbi:tetratricopeptide repeat protein [Legionella cardiaca]|uniref:Tetratricopeptide repeat protein 38 n=1 Tax=Legionella cardiaca TaxID=1071983 RepID=A0ABY8AXN5_9GAMM|nr:tetratricopeptide repeat protein [Legionella cardiaca]WED44226.1 tetratricopeptide repeat protein [Legionella cardiaca]
METYRGLKVTTNSDQVIDDINYFHNQILGSGNNAIAILDAVKRNPDNLLLQTYAAAFYLYAQENAATEIAANYLLQAEKQLRQANLREKLTYYAARAWLRLDYAAAITLLTTIIELYPRDTLAIKFAEWLFYCSGQAFQAKQFLALCESCSQHNQDESHFLAIHSFALELCGHYPQAKAVAEQAIAMGPITPWSHHTLAHVYLMENDINGGIKRLEDLRNSWTNILPLLKGHNTWHLALFHLANRDETETMKLFPDIFGTLPDTLLEQLDAISLLWRMDMAGLPQEELLKKILLHLGVHPFEYYIGFNNVHFIYCLAKLGKTELAEKAIKDLELYISTLPLGAVRNLWKNVALPMCLGVNAFAQNNYQLAAEKIDPIIENCYQLGGSDAQTELYTQTYLLSLLGSKQEEKAKQFFSKHLSHYRNTALADYWFNEW